MRLIVIGEGRPKVVWAALNALRGSTWVSAVIDGRANGAQPVSVDWAKKNKIPVRRFTPVWMVYGRGANKQRTLEILAEYRPDLCICFTLPEVKPSHDTRTSLSLFKTAGVEVRNEKG